MKQQQAFLSHLLDFSNVQSKRSQYQQAFSTFGTQFNKDVQHDKKQSYTQRYTNQNITKPSQAQLVPGNQKLLKAFSQLRQKLNQTNRQLLVTKQDNQVLSKQRQQMREKEKHYMGQVQKLNKVSINAEQQCTQLKARLNNLKQTIQVNQQRSEETQYLKLTIQRLIQENKRMKEQVRLSMQVGIQQKIGLQQQLQRVKLNQIQHAKSFEEMENQLYTKNKQYILLDNQFKKLRISYQQQVYLKKVSSQAIFIQRQNQQLRIRNDELQSKLKRQKNKKYQLQARLLQLQEKVRLYGTKTDIYEGQLSTIAKKMRKVCKQQQSTKKQANQAINEKLSWQEKFYNTVVICEQLIGRVKRQLKGDAVELARTCEFRVNKLKNDEKVDLVKQRLLKVNISNSKSNKKRPRSQTQKVMAQKQNPLSSSQQPTNINMLNTFGGEAFPKNNYNQPQMNQIMTKEQNTMKRDPSKNSMISKTVLKQRPQQNIFTQTKNNNSNDNDGIQNIKKRLFSGENQRTKTTIKNMQTTTNKLNNLSANNNYNDLNLEAKIRKQRQIMERKLREKILFHKIQDATSQPLKNKLRQEYFNINQFDL